MATIIALTSNKGGTGKTTIALGLAGALAQQQFRVLLIDMDQQGNATSGTGQLCPPQHHVGTWLRGHSEFEQTLLKGNKGIDLIPAGQEIIQHEQLLSAERGVECTLSDNLKVCQDQYDYILIDCPPNLGVMTFIALTAAHFYIVPMQGENFAYLGLESIQKCVLNVQRKYNPDLRLAGIALNKFQLKTRFGKALYDQLSANPGIHLFQTKVRQCISLMECSAEGVSIFEYDQTSTGAIDFLALAGEVSTLTPKQVANKP